MNIMNKLFLVPLATLILTTTACSDKKNTSTNSAKTTETTTNNTAQGNWKAKANELSSANATDIKADLIQLNQIINHSNIKAIELRDEASKAKNAPDKIKKILVKSHDIQAEVQQQIMGLNLKSQEVQNIRTQMIDNLMTASKLFDLSMASDFNMTSPSEDFKQLTQRSMAIQQKIAMKLDALNTQYSK